MSNLYLLAIVWKFENENEIIKLKSVMWSLFGQY